MTYLCPRTRPDGESDDRTGGRVPQPAGRGEAGTELHRGAAAGAGDRAGRHGATAPGAGPVAGHVPGQLQAIYWLGLVDTANQEAARELFNYAIAPTEAEIAQVQEEIATTDETLDTNWGLYTATDMTGREEARDRFDAALAEFRQVRTGTLIPQPSPATSMRSSPPTTRRARRWRPR